jgi:hypothetical protein
MTTAIMILFVLPFFFFFGAIGAAQNSSMLTSTPFVFDSGVPTEAPVSELHSETWRP